MAFASLTDDEQARLGRAPLAILAHVGGADGEVDDRERQALGAWIEATATAGGVAGEMAEAARATPPGSVANGLDELRALRPLLEQRLTPDEAAAIRDALLAAGEAIAAASGGFLGLGDRMSAEEHVALREAGRALGTLSRRALASGAVGFSHILVPLDGSAESEAALRPAFDMARDMNSKVTLLEVSTSFQQLSRMVAVDAFITPAAVDSILEASEAEKQAAAAYLAGIKSALGMPEWATVVREGDPATVIEEEAEASGADLITMAAVERGAFARVLEPSVSEAVLKRSRIPVLVVPVGKRAKDQA